MTRASTRFNHINCGGAIVLDMSKHLKLIAPTFSLGESGISQLVVDVHQCDDIRNSRKVDPHWQCASCLQDISKEKAGDSLCMVCQVCSHQKSVNECFFNEYLSGVCESCVKALKEESSEKTSERIADFKSAFNFNFKTKFTPMLEVISKPILV